MMILMTILAKKVSIFSKLPKPSSFSYV